jgi:hypothetical protein
MRQATTLHGAFEDAARDTRRIRLQLRYLSSSESLEGLVSFRAKALNRLERLLFAAILALMIFVVLLIARSIGSAAVAVLASWTVTSFAMLWVIAEGQLQGRRSQMEMRVEQAYIARILGATGLTAKNFFFEEKGFALRKIQPSPGEQLLNVRSTGTGRVFEWTVSPSAFPYLIDRRADDHVSLALAGAGVNIEQLEAETRAAYRDLRSRDEVVRAGDVLDMLSGRGYDNLIIACILVRLYARDEMSTEGQLGRESVLAFKDAAV